MLTSPDKLADCCPQCGATHFQVAHVAQYQLSPGAPDALYSETIAVVVCLCGHAIPVERLDSQNEEHRSLQTSLELVRQYQESTRAQAKTNDSHDFITSAEFQAVSDKVGALEAALQRTCKKDDK